MKHFVISVAACSLVGCTPPGAPTVVASSRTQKACAARMYAARQPHAAVNWNIYDYCMAHFGKEP